MKKQLLFSISVFFSGFLFSQITNQLSKIPPSLSNISILKSSKVDDYISSTAITYQARVLNTSNLQSVNTLAETIIGNTYYDLQSNSSVGDRIVVNADGSIAACWTFEGIADGGDMLIEVLDMLITMVQLGLHLLH